MEKPLITFVCIANYCRSPVAEQICKKLYKNYQFKSCGIAPLAAAFMSRRSSRYLDSIGIENVTHIPKSISKIILEKSEIIFCMDHVILHTLNKKYPTYISKFKLFNFKSPNTIINDPYSYPENEYIDAMKKIDSLCQSLL